MGKDGTHHLLIPLLRLKVAHRFRLLNPRVPDNGVFEVVAHDVQRGLAVLDDGGGVLLDGGVDAVDFAGDREVWGALLGLLGVEEFVDVRGAVSNRNQ